MATGLMVVVFVLPTVVKITMVMAFQINAQILVVILFLFQKNMQRFKMPSM